MHLVNAHRRVALVRRAAPFGQCTCRWQGRHATGGVGAQLRCPRVGIGLERQNGAVGPHQLELVEVTHLHVRHEDFPHARVVAQPHRMPAPIPDIELAHDTHALGVRCPHRKAHAGHAALLYWMGAEHGIGTQMVAGAQGLQVSVIQLRTKAVSVGIAAALAVVPRHVQQIVEALAAPRNAGFEQTAGVA